MSSLARTQEGPDAAVTALWFAADGWVPNNQRLPALLYRQAIPDARDRAATCEALFDENGWPPQWRNGIYPFHHYHSTAYEVLGIARGSGRVLFGGSVTKLSPPSSASGTLRRPEKALRGRKRRRHVRPVVPGRVPSPFSWPPAPA